LGHNIFWYIPQRVYAVQVSGIIDVDELKQISEESVSFIRAGQPPVFAIIDMRQMSSMPRSLRDIRKAVHALQESGLKWAILISNDTILKFMANIMTQAVSVNHRAFSQPADALAFLAEQDPTLSPMPAFPESVAAD